LLEKNLINFQSSYFFFNLILSDIITVNHVKKKEIPPFIKMPPLFPKSFDPNFPKMKGNGSGVSSQLMKNALC
jgi:hypothetical protein